MMCCLFFLHLLQLLFLVLLLFLSIYLSIHASIYPSIFPSIYHTLLKLPKEKSSKGGKAAMRRSEIQPWRRISALCGITKSLILRRSLTVWTENDGSVRWGDFLSLEEAARLCCQTLPNCRFLFSFFLENAMKVGQQLDAGALIFDSIWRRRIWFSPNLCHMMQRGGLFSSIGCGLRSE